MKLRRPSYDAVLAFVTVLVCIAAVSFNVLGAWMQMHRPQAAHDAERAR